MHLIRLTAVLLTGVLLAGAAPALASSGGDTETSLDDLRERSLLVERGSGVDKVVALTFDDGPHPEYTHRILRILDFYDARATFFVVGSQAERYPEWVKMANQLGNEIASHTYEHFRLNLLSEQEAEYQVRENQELISELVGYKPLFLRPPGGALDERTGSLAGEFGMLIAWWSYNTNDLGITDPDKLADNVLENTEPGSIVLMHDGSETAVEALPRILRELREDGYRFVTMSELYSRMGPRARKLLADRGLLSRDSGDSAYE